MKKSPLDLSLYLVTEESIRLEDLKDIIVQSAAGGVSMVQLREKTSSSLAFYKKAKEIKALLHQLSVPFVINDRVDIALAVGADGIHIGQDDLPLSIVKDMIPEHMFIGVSVATLEEAQEAEASGADYIGVGSVFPTVTKEDAVLVSIEEVENIAKSVSIPTVAIGGISLNNIKELSGSGIDGVAVVSAIMNAEDPKLAARQLSNQMKYIRDNS